MKINIIFLSIIAPILCNSTPPNELEVSIKKDWENMPGYEFLGKFVHPRDRFKVSIFHRTQPTQPIILPSKIIGNSDNDVFYFPIEKNYGVEDLSVKIEVAKYKQGKMNGMLIFLLIIVPILHKCNSAGDETHHDVLQVAIIKDWQNKSGYEFLGKLIYPKHRFNVQIYRNTPPYIPPIGPFQADQNTDADLFYFRKEKKYKAEEFSVSIGVAKYGVSVVAQYDQIIIRKKVGVVSILPGGETEPIAAVPTHRQERSEGKIQNEAELKEEINELDEAEKIVSTACRDDELRCLERQWAGFYIGVRKNEKKMEELLLKRQTSHISVENLKKEEIALHLENANLENRRQQILQRQTQLLFPQLMASAARQSNTVPLWFSNMAAGMILDSGGMQRGESSSSQRQMTLQQFIASFAAQASALQPTNTAGGIFVPPSAEMHPRESGSSLLAGHANVQQRTNTDTLGRSNSMRLFGANLSTDVSPTFGQSGTSGAGQSSVPNPLNPQHASIPPTHRTASSSDHSSSRRSDPNQPNPGTSGQSFSRGSQIGPPFYSSSGHPNSSGQQPQFIPSQSNIPLDSIIERNDPLNSGNPIAAVPLRKIATKETIVHRDKGKGQASSENQKESDSKELGDIKFGWVRRYYFEIDSNPAYKECEEIGTVLHKTKKQIIHQFNLLRRNNKTMTEEERVENRKKRDKFMKEMSKGFAKQLKKKKTGKKNVQIAPPPPPPPTKETIGHMEKGKGKRPASSAAAEEQPQRKARIKYNEEEKAWLFWYRDHVFIYTSSKMDARNKEMDEIAGVIRRIEPLRTGNELLNHRSHKDLIVIEEEPRQKLHEAFMKKMRAEFPENPENGAPLPSIDDLSVPAPMDERA